MYDLGVAVQTDAGLVVPVVRGCDTATLDELAAETARLADAARAGTLKPEELRGGTFTVTSAGKLGGVLVTPLVNHPEVGILGLHRAFLCLPGIAEPHPRRYSYGQSHKAQDDQQPDPACRSGAGCLRIGHRGLRQ